MSFVSCGRDGMSMFVFRSPIQISGDREYVSCATGLLIGCESALWTGVVEFSVRDPMWCALLKFSASRGSARHGIFVLVHLRGLFENPVENKRSRASSGDGLRMSRNLTYSRSAHTIRNAENSNNRASEQNRTYPRYHPYHFD